MQIHGFNKTTLLDFPGHIAGCIFTGACNLRCPFCQNASLVLHPQSEPVIPEDEVLSYLAKRKGILEGLCITGGEPTLNKDLPDFIKKVKDLGLLVKLDTNGTNPELLKSLVLSGLVDYVAMDIKSSKESYAKAAGVQGLDISPIEDSVSFLLEGHVEYEFRTTAVKELISPSDFMQIGMWLDGADKYYLQGYKDSGDLIAGAGLSGYSRAELEPIAGNIKHHFKLTEIRGLD